MTGHDQRRTLGVFMAGLDTKGPSLTGEGGGAVGASANDEVESAERQIALAVGPRESFGRHAPDPFAARDVDFISGRNRRWTKGVPIGDGAYLGHG